MNELIQLTQTIAGVAVIACVGWSILLVCMFLASLIERKYPDQDLESEIVTRQMARRNERMRILNQIKATPNHIDGSLTDEQKQLWKRYHKLEAEDRELLKKESDLIIDKKGWL